ncbi:carotenoid biosynthesis protein [Mycolicibacter kumamotonensis]|uniref:Carotenoid biosynthesis protein n=1 Tax=Mycolicibacter kumamotonensis TaxID=354243 RepID=A0A7K3LG51_9MYCO|nr:carotenoid biosynthesis protein [Mycolicibacter kumamotonensis]NDJ91339.1 carotenoid biosynthesis protein [Mycolicibacter kumamotonensis]
MSTRTRGRAVACWCLVAVWFAATVTAALSAGSPIQNVAEAVYGAALAAFVVLHTLTLYRPAGAITYFAVAVTVAFGFEACSVATGFPFGSYVHHFEGPRALGVPFTVVLGWVVLAWLAWVLARVIVGENRGHRALVIVTPVIATFILGGYDLVIDPIAAYARGLYSYGSPSGALGVPLSNYFGWLFTGWVIFQVFSLVERRWRREPTATPPRATLLMPAVIWFGLALQVNLEMLRVGDATATLQGGRVIPLSDIYSTCCAMSWFTMGLVVAISVARLYPGRPDDNVAVALKGESS